MPQIVKPRNVEAIIKHLKDVNYPVSGKEFMKACDNMSDIPEDQRVWVKKNLPPKFTYNSAEEIKHYLDI